jgi:four helix bundle protein
MTARSNTPPFRSFFVVDLAVEAIEMARPFVDRLRRHDRELETQMRRALTRCGLALGEGQKREGGNQQAAYRRARGEANEALTAVRLAAAWGYMEGSNELIDKLDHLVAVLVRLTR